MRIPRKFHRLAQELLNEAGGRVAVDGVFGPQSNAEAVRVLRKRYPAHRSIALLVQKAYNSRVLAAAAGITVLCDAWWGPVTEEAAETLLAVREDRELPVRPDEEGKCRSDAPAAVRCWTPTDGQMRRRYGRVGENQVLIDAPYPLRLDWDLKTVVRKIRLHKDVADSGRAGLEAVLDAYGAEGVRELGLDRYGGSLNVRKKRGGTTWSAHAWGTAMDFWPSVNRLRETRKTARFARGEYVKWWQCWEAVGWMSLGRCYDFDWMHIQKNP